VAANATAATGVCTSEYGGGYRWNTAVSDPVIVALIVAGGGLIQTALTLWTHNKLEVIHKEVNGQTAALLKVTGDSREAVGKLKGKAEAKEQEEDDVSDRLA